MACTDSREDRYGSLMWGIGLVLVGAVFLLQYLDIMPFVGWRHWWPFFPMLIGVAHIVSGRSPRRIGSGVSILMIGGWCFIATNHVLGLTWANSWPLALVASGTGMVVRSLVSWFMDRGDGVREVKSDD